MRMAASRGLSQEGATWVGNPTVRERQVVRPSFGSQWARQHEQISVQSDDGRRRLDGAQLRA